MSIRSLARFASCFALLSAPVGAVPLTYAVVPNDSNTQVLYGTRATLDSSSDFTEGSINGETGQLPFTNNTVATSNTKPSAGSSLVADVGIPGNFDDGANGITFSQLTMQFDNLPGGVSFFSAGTSLAGFGIKPGEGPIPGIPATVAETPLILFGAVLTFSNLNITLNAPFSSALTADPANPGQYLWAGPADVTVSGEFAPEIDVSPSNPDPVPFSIPVQAFPLTGSFVAGLGGSEVVVGLDSDGLAELTENQTLEIEPIDLPVTIPVSQLGLEALLGPLEEALGPILAQLLLEDIYAELGEDVFASFKLTPQLFFDANGFEVHYVNATPVPEPGTAALVALGCAGLAVVRRRGAGRRFDTSHR